MTREEFKAEAKKVIDTERFGILGALFEYESFEEMKVAHIPNDSCSAESDMSLDDFLDKLYERIKQEPVLDKIRSEIQNLRNCSCSCSDGIIDDVEDIIDKYKAETENT